MRDIILTAIIIGLIPMIIRRTDIGVLTWNWLSFMNPHRLTWGFAYSLPWNQLVAIVTLGSLFFSKEKKSFPWSKLTVIWLGFIVWVNLSTLVATFPAEAFEEWDRFMKIQLMVFVSLLVMKSPERIRALVWVITLSIGFYGVKGGYFALITGGEYLVWGPAKSFIGGNNEIALALIIIQPLLWFLRQLSENRWVRLGLLASVALCFIAIISTYSRGAFLAGAVMLVLLILKSNKKLLFAPILVVMAMTAVMFMPDQWSDRMSTIQTYQEDGSARGRINSWMFAFNLAKDQPFFGGGFGAFDAELFARYAPNPTDVHDAHSIYFEVLGEHGFVGLAFYLSLAIGVLFLTQKTQRRARRIPGQSWVADLAAMIQVSFIGYGVGGAFLGLAYFDLPYQLFAISILLSKLIDEAEAKQQEETVDTGTSKQRNIGLPGRAVPSGVRSRSQQDRHTVKPRR